MSALLNYDKVNDKLSVGSVLTHQRGGASGTSERGLYNFFYLRIMSETRYGVFYSNVLDRSANAFVIGEVTPSNDLVQLGPEYLVSAPMVAPVRMGEYKHNNIICN